ncbi:hypothetical protein B6I21_03215 [candidate division KSB1 bacterium 4572_119]|nr:MAG: hypothetical protein B6I21_03215 [candidate division KSB1 bacterium 4572_119]
MKIKAIIIVIITLLLFITCADKKNNIESIFNQAEKLQKDVLKSVNQIASCKEKYETILKQTPESEFAPQACYQLGKLNEIFDHYDEAVAYYKKLLSFYPEHSLCADALFNIARINRVYLDKKAQAVNYYDQLTGLCPDNNLSFQAMIEKGKIFIHDKEWEQAIQCYEQIIQQYPNHRVCDDLMARMAEIYQANLKEPESSIKMYQKLLNSYPNSPWTELAKIRINEFAEGGKKNEK